MKKKSSDAAARVTRHIPLRSCVVCRDEKPKRELLRVVCTTDGVVEVDESGKKPGRGAYLCWSTDCWEKALTKGKLERALRGKIDPESRKRLIGFSNEFCGEVGEAK